MAELRETYLPRADDSDVRCYLAMMDGLPIGYIQSYVAAKAGEGWWPDERDLGVVGIDQFLADEQRLGQGLGTRMVTEFVHFLFQDPAVTRIQADPVPANLRAIRCYRKAGFHSVGEIITPDGPALLMVLERSALESRRT
jgi:aminoglycoside 6'-N-acetyltransferase-1b